MYGLVAGLSLSAHNSGIAAAALSQPFSIDTRIPRPDFDHDGLPDAYEQSAGLNWQVADAGEDPDNDGKTNLQEYNAGTDPDTPDRPQAVRALSGAFTVATGRVSSADSDSDGMPDWWELRYGLDPGTANGADDHDLDGRSNLAEYLAGKDPLIDDLALNTFSLSQLFAADTGGRLRDTDADGLPNWWETLFFTNTTTAARFADPDGDRHDNLEEFRAGTNPTDGQSVFAIIEVRSGPPSIVRWSSVTSRTYSLWTITDGDLTLQPVASNLVATPPVNSFTNVAPTGRGLYRVSTAP